MSATAAGRLPRRPPGTTTATASSSLVILVVIVVVDHGDNADLDIDLLGVVQLDGITLEHLGRGRIGLVRFGVDGGVGWFFRHSGSYVTDG